ncbi:MAG: hypothetical protein ACJ8ER_05940 [Allosphingosinicella sp.]
MTFRSGYPPPAAISAGTFDLRNGCLVLKPEPGEAWLVAVVPPGSSFTRDSRGAPDGVTVEGASVRFGQLIRFGGGVTPYDLGEKGRACPGATVVVGSILK